MRTQCRSTIRRGAATIAILASGILGATDARAQATCTTPLTSGLKFPLAIVQTNQRNLLVSETGEHGVLHSGRISMVSTDGIRRTLVDGLPSATNDVNEPAGPAGLVMRGRTLYVAIGIGDTILPVGTTPVRIGNPAPASRLFSSVLAMHFSAHTERTTTGFDLSVADQESLADGQTVRLADSAGNKLTIELVANFPDYVANPTPTAPANVRGSNPFDLELIGDQLYVTDGGRNLVWKADIHTGSAEPLATFPPIANPTPVGAPVIEAVPTGIREFEGQLFVTLFRGFPFPPGTSVVEQIDPATGAHAPAVSGLRTAVDVLFADDGEHAAPVVLQHASGPLLPPFSGPGSLTRLDGSLTTVLANCLGRPTSMVRDEHSGVFYITELVGGRVVMVR